MYKRGRVRALCYVCHMEKGLFFTKLKRCVEEKLMWRFACGSMDSVELWTMQCQDCAELGARVRIEYYLCALHAV
jgi:hypothetical protein